MPPAPTGSTISYAPTRAPRDRCTGQRLPQPAVSGAFQVCEARLGRVRRCRVLIRQPMTAAIIRSASFSYEGAPTEAVFSGTDDVRRVREDGRDAFPKVEMVV